MTDVIYASVSDFLSLNYDLISYNSFYLTHF